MVFVDEVDKIKDTKEIDKFIRILKSLYVPRNLFFIVSISEDAFDEYQKRAVLKKQRTVFDSAFDQFTQLKMMGVEDTVAGDEDDYVQIAVRLGKDCTWRERIADKVKKQRSRVFNDETPIRALEEFFERVCRETRAVHDR